MKKLWEVAEFKVTNSFSRDNLNYENGTVKNIHYGDIHTKFQTLFDITKEIVPYINEGISINRISEDFYCKEGDIIFADASEDLNDVGKSIEILNLNNEKLLSGLHTLLARPKANYFQKGFKGYLFKSDSVRLQIQKEAQGSKVLSINVGRISNVELSFPTFLEQQKITALLSLLEEKILSQNKIIGELKLLKNAISKKIFSLQLRFKDDDGSHFPDWKIMKLGEIGKFYAGGDLGKLDYKKEKKTGYQYPIYANGAGEGLFGYANSFQFPPNCVTVSGRGNLGYAKTRKSNFNAIVRLIVVNPNNDINPKFLEEAINNMNFAIESTGVPQLTIPQIISYSILIPCLEEQNQIANSLSSIAKKTEIERRILKQLESQKKYLLSNLFI
ncbi:restriction endonuclease subunit S [Flavobacterium sp. XS2P12]